MGCSPWGHQEWDTTERLHFHFHALEKEMATHSSVLAWRIPGTGEPGGLPSMGLHRVGHDWSDLAVAVAAVSIPGLGRSPGESESESCSVMSSSLPPLGLYSPQNSPGQDTGVGSLSLLQQIFQTQESNQDLPHCRRILYQLSCEGSPPLEKEMATHSSILAWRIPWTEEPGKAIVHGVTHTHTHEGSRPAFSRCP